MRPAVVMDTNVAIVANAQTPQAGIQCVQACIQALKRIRAEQRLLLDQNGLILEEYRHHLSPAGQPGPGDAFFKWLWYNQANERYCRRVPLTPASEDDRTFVEFPDDPDLVRFDRSDRKFVAVALASAEDAPILNASDTDWYIFREALTRHHVLVQDICPELMAAHR